MVQLSKRHTV